jgi:hypothetical protein
VYCLLKRYCGWLLKDTVKLPYGENPVMGSLPHLISVLHELTQRAVCVLNRVLWLTKLELYCSWCNWKAQSIVSNCSALFQYNRAYRILCLYLGKRSEEGQKIKRKERRCGFPYGKCLWLMKDFTNVKKRNPKVVSLGI